MSYYSHVEMIPRVRNRCVLMCYGSDGRVEHARKTSDPRKKGSSNNLHFALGDI